MRRLVEQRMALRAQLAEQSTTLLDQHPRIKELRAQIAELDRQIRSEGERLARQLDNDAKVAGDRMRDADREPRSGQASSPRRATSRTCSCARSNARPRPQRDLLESYLAKYREASARDNINAAPPEARIISRATPAIMPAYPKKLPMVLIAAFAGFALSAGFIVTGALLAAPGSSAAPGYAYAPRAAMAAPVDAPPAMASPPVPRMAAAAIGARANAAPAPAAMPAGGNTIDQLAAQLRQEGDEGRRIAVFGTMRNVGTDLCRHHAGAHARQGCQCGAGRSRLQRAQSVGDLDRAGCARHCRTDPRAGFVRRHHHPRPGFARASGGDRRRRPGRAAACRLADAGDRDRGAGAQLRSCGDRRRLRRRQRGRASGAAGDPRAAGDRRSRARRPRALRASAYWPRALPR